MVQECRKFLLMPGSHVLTVMDQKEPEAVPIVTTTLSIHLTARL